MANCEGCGRLLPEGARHSPASADAQARADRIAAFHEELAELRRAGVVHLAEDELDSVERFHERVRRELVERFDVDLSERGKQISFGMRAVSLIGAFALAASVFFLFHRVWGLIAMPLQVAVLVAAPLAGLVGTDLVAARDRSRYFTSMAALFAVACFVVDISLLGESLNQAAAPWILGAWGAFALILAYAYRLGLVHAVGLVALAAFGGGLITGGLGGDWPNMLESPESLLAPGAALTVLGLILTRRPAAAFLPIFRTVGLAVLLGPMFLVAMWSRLSRLPTDPETTSLVYQILLAGLCAAAVWFGIARRMRDTAYCGMLFGVALLYAKFTRLCWSWMPKYLFFLIVAASAMALLWLLKRMRAALGPAPQPAGS